MIKPIGGKMAKYMGDVLFADASRPGQVEILDSGAVRVKADIARTGVQDYAPHQFPESGVTGRPVRLFRPAEEVFSDSSLATLPSSPVTIGHPRENVNKKNWRQLAVGAVEGRGERVRLDDGEEYIRVPLILQDESAVDGVEEKSLREISQGYKGKIDWTAGITDSGAPYDGIVRDIRHNHTALLGAGKARAGQGARVLLDSTGAEPITPLEENMADEKEKVDLEKIREEVRAELKAEIKDEADKEAARVAEEKRLADEKVALTEREKAAEEAKQSLQDASEKTLRDTQDLLDTRDTVKRMLPASFDVSGKSARELKEAAIAEHLPKADIKDASDERIEGLFDGLKALETRYVKKTEVDTSIKDHNEELRRIYAERTKVEG